MWLTNKIMYIKGEHSISIYNLAIYVYKFSTVNAVFKWREIIIWSNLTFNQELVIQTVVKKFILQNK